jgi:large subunit ribosomal protein L17
MRHRKRTAKLGRTSSHRGAMISNMITSLFRHERIKTTVQKAKETRRFAEKAITLAKKNTLHARRLANEQIKDEEVLGKLFSVIGPRFAGRSGGYTRIIRLGHREGDGAEMALLELVDRIAPPPEKEEKKKARKKKKAEEEKAAAEESVAEAKPVKEDRGVDEAPGEAVTEDRSQDDEAAAEGASVDAQEPTEKAESSKESPSAGETKEQKKEGPKKKN